MIASMPKPTTASYRRGCRQRYTDRMSDSPVSPFAAGLSCRCPRCGKGRLFDGYLKVVPRCEDCGLDLTFADSGDGPSIFVIFAVGPIVVILAFIADALFHPAPWMHLLLW